MSGLARAVWLVVLFGAVGCLSAKPLYPGARRSPEQVARLKMVTNGAITTVNGLKLEGRHYELLPGQYDVEFRFIVQGGELHGALEEARGTGHCFTRVRLEAGRDYEIDRTRFRRDYRRTGQRETAGARMTELHARYRLILRRVSRDQADNPENEEEITCLGIPD